MLKPVIEGNVTRCIVKRNAKAWKVEHYRKMLNRWNREIWVLTHEFHCDEFIEKVRHE